MGVSQNNSVQSTITLVLRKFCLNDDGIYLSICSLVGQSGIWARRRYMKLIQLIKILDTEPFVNMKEPAKMLIGKASQGITGG